MLLTVGGWATIACMPIRQPFSYEITIVKTGGPTKQSFDFAGNGYQNASTSFYSIMRTVQNVRCMTKEITATPRFSKEK